MGCNARFQLRLTAFQRLTRYFVSYVRFGMNRTDSRPHNICYERTAEVMLTEQLVEMMGVFLADYKIIFEEEHRRTCLIESLDIFMDADWPSARRLLYRLSELIQ